MNEQLFWEMYEDGRLTSLAQNNPLEFDIVWEEVIEEAVKNSGQNTDDSRLYADRIIKGLLWEAPTFDQRMKLARDYPEVFKRNHERLMASHIRLLKDKKKIERATNLQWRIYREIERHSTPLGSCIALNRMMCESMWGKNGLSDALNGLVTSSSNTNDELHKSQPCTVLSFERKEKK